MNDLASFRLDEAERVVFHVSASSFDAFDEAYLGTGPDNNSALGFYFSDNPTDISLYIRDGRRLIVCAVNVENPYEIPSYYEMFGFDENGTVTSSKDDFADKRLTLIRLGHDAAEYSDTEETMLIALSSSSIRKIADLSVDQAKELAEMISNLTDSEDDQARLDCLRIVLQDVSVPTP